MEAAMTLINFAIKLFDPRAMAAVALVFLPLERLLPLHDPRPRRTGWTTDLVYFLVNGAVIRTAMFLVIVALGKGASVLVPQGLRQSVAGLPLWLQAITLILAADFGFYWPIGCFTQRPRFGGSTPSITAASTWTGWPRSGCIRSIRCFPPPPR
jgi:sterol desaturase/sphingolipid hydroxylase (fatty acid hydroxylase superfamily)